LDQNKLDRGRVLATTRYLNYGLDYVLSF
jgi:hypothetical protein